jgi:hypothetical protein
MTTTRITSEMADLINARRELMYAVNDLETDGAPYTKARIAYDAALNALGAFDAAHPDVQTAALAFVRTLDSYDRESFADDAHWAVGK